MNNYERDVGEEDNAEGDADNADKTAAMREQCRRRRDADSTKHNQLMMRRSTKQTTQQQDRTKETKSAKQNSRLEKHTPKSQESKAK